jgi:PilZ domain
MALQRHWVKTVSSMQVTTGPSRRRSSRIPALDDVWIYWESHPYRDVSRIRDLSPGGLFLETHARKREGETVRLHFLVQEGQIRAEAVVRHVIDGRGFGMKIESLTSQDAPQLRRLLSRLRENSMSTRLHQLVTKPIRPENS